MTAPGIKQKPHIQQVDYIRATASLVVALFHLGGKVLPVLKYGWLGVYMFFLLSGFIICWAIPLNYNWQMSWRFIVKRFIRIEPPYLVSIVLALIASFVLVANYHPNWGNVAGHLAYLNNFTGQPYLSPVYWTLGIEFQFYLFVALCFPLIISKAGPWILLLFSVLSIVVNVQAVGLVNLFPVFALGILYFLFLKNRMQLGFTFIVGIIITICSCYNTGWQATSFALLALVILVLPLKSYPVIAFLSKISFSLYLTHDIIGSNLVVYLGTLLPKTFIFKGIEFITGIVVSILFAWLFNVLVEAPFLKLSKKYRYKI
jgi:peptidoglycan/LPS O-acetylase OafA/YrhL